MMSSNSKQNVPFVTKVEKQYKISKWNLAKIFIVIVVITFVSFFVDDNLAWDYTTWKPIKIGYKENVVWHYGFTIAVLQFIGKKRTLASCRLILNETKEQKREKPRILSELIHQGYNVQEVNFFTMLSIVQSCQELRNERMQNELKNHHNLESKAEPKKINYLTLFKGIVPGTKWCGIDDIADNYFDLGKDFEVDKCCRTHDHCPMKIKALGSSYGIKNNHPYTKSHCACDDLFYNCLKSIIINQPQSKISKLASHVGAMFFNILRLDCIEPVYPKVCVESTIYYKISRLLGWQKTSPSREESYKPEEGCSRWEEDQDADPTNIKFLKMSKSF